MRFGEPGHERRASRLMPAIAHRLAQVLVRAGLERADEEQRALEVEDGVAQRQLLRQDRVARATCAGRRSGVATTSRIASGQAVVRADDAAVVALAADRQAAEQRRGGVVGMALELGRERSSHSSGARGAVTAS